MRRISLIGSIARAATTAIALAVTLSSAEARGFRLRLGVGSAVAETSAPAPPRAIERLAAAIPLPIAAAAPRVSPGVERPEPVAALTPVLVAPASERTKPSSQPVRVSGPWCPSDRIVGAGAGFCQIN